MHTMPLLRTLLRPSSSSSSSTAPTLSPTLKSLLRLPSSCRTTTPSRLFHATPRPQSPILSTIYASHDALLTLHTTTSLPWSLTIPLFAILLRTTIILPITIYTRLSNIKQISLHPLVSSWKPILQHDTMREVGHLGPVVAQSTLLKKMRQKRGEIYRRHGCGNWKNFLSLLQIPLFLSAMEALRRMCGSKQGILGMMMGGDVAVVPAGAGVDNTAAIPTGDGLVESAISIPLETSLATEGALWFPNLLAADPHLVLPFVLSGTILLNILNKPTSYAAMSIWKKRTTRFLSLVALCIGPLMLNVPTALLIYWISSSASAVLQAVLLNRFLPLPKPVVPCQPKGVWKSGFGAKRPEGYVNPLLATEKTETAKASGGKKVKKVPRPLVQNAPVGKTQQRRR